MSHMQRKDRTRLQGNFVYQFILAVGFSLMFFAPCIIAIGHGETEEEGA